MVFSKVLTEPDVEAFARLCGDYNPLHMDSGYARQTHLGRRVVHGMLVASYVSTLIGMQLPGAGSLWMQQSFRWRAPVYIGDTLEFTLRVTHKSEGSRILSLEVTAMNQNGKTVMDGEGTVSLPEVRRNGAEIPIHERVAFVSGGSRGIGAAAARALAHAGAGVVVNYRSSAAAAEELCHAITADGGKAFAVRSDVNDAESVSRAVESAAAQLGRTIDVLIHCAGGTGRAAARGGDGVGGHPAGPRYSRARRVPLYSGAGPRHGAAEVRQDREHRLHGHVGGAAGPVERLCDGQGGAEIHDEVAGGGAGAERDPHQHDLAGHHRDGIRRSRFQSGFASCRRCRRRCGGSRRPKTSRRPRSSFVREASGFITGADIPVCGGVGM